MKTLHSPSIALVLALAAGCSSAPLGTATNTYVGNQAGKQEEHVGDRDLAAKFVLVDIKTEKRPDGRLRVQFDLRNTTSADLAIEWHIDWMDASGFRLDTQPHWRPLVVAGSSSQPIQETAPVPEAATFQLQFRKPTPVR